MRKFIALLISLSMLTLCACSGENGDSSSETQSDVSQTQNQTEYVTDWGTDLLPANFPAPPSGMHELTVESGSASDDGYRSDWVRLVFTCFEKDIYEFSNQLIANGYMGGIKNIASPSTYFLEGFNGSWHDGENLVIINNAAITESGEVAFVFDVMKCIESFPDALETIFPRFNGYAKGTGQYYRYNEDMEIVSREFEGTFSDNSWYWDFGFENAFVGVTLEQLTEYENALVEALFAGNSATSVVDGCTVISYDLVKEVGDDVYGVFMAYNQTLKTLDIVYTNDISLVTGQEIQR